MVCSPADRIQWLVVHVNEKDPRNLLGVCTAIKRHRILKLQYPMSVFLFSELFKSEMYFSLNLSYWIPDLIYSYRSASSLVMSSQVIPFSAISTIA